MTSAPKWDAWRIQPDTSGNDAALPSAEATGSVELYIAPYQTIEREVPRLVGSEARLVTCR